MAAVPMLSQCTQKILSQSQGAPEGAKLYGEVQLNLTPEIEVIYMLFDTGRHIWWRTWVGLT